MIYTDLVNRASRSQQYSYVDGLKPVEIRLFRDLHQQPPHRISSEQHHIVDSLQRHIDQHHLDGGVSFRGKQLNIYEDVRDFFRYGLHKGFVKVPPRVGKTTLMAKIAGATDIPTIIAVPSNFLVEQTQNEFRKFAPHIQTGVYHGGKKEPDAQVVIATYQSLVPAVCERNLFTRTHPMLFEDEGHHALTDKRLPLLDHFRYVISWSATERFSVRKAVSNHIENCIHYMHLREAIEWGLLAPVQVRLIKTDVDLSNVSWSMGKYDEKEFLNTVRRQGLAEKSAELHRLNHPNEIGIGFCQSVDEARYFADVYRSKGISSEAVSGYDSKNFVRDAMNAHRAGTIQMAFCADLLTESYDNPLITVVHGLTPSYSPVLTEQSRSRGLTLDPNNPDKKTVVYEYYFQDEGNRPPGVTLFDILEGTVVYPLGSTNVNLGQNRISAELVDNSEIVNIDPFGQDKTIIDVTGMEVLLSEVKVRDFVAAQKNKYQRMMVFSVRNLLALGRALAEDQEFANLTLKRFVEIGKSAEASKYLNAVGLPRWPAGSKTVIDYFGSWQLYRKLVLTYAETGRLAPIEPAQRIQEILPVLRMIENTDPRAAFRFWSMLRDDQRSLDRLEETLLTELPQLLSGTYRLDDPAVREWLCSYHLAHIETMARNFCTRFGTLDYATLVTEGVIGLIDTYDDYDGSDDRTPDRLELLSAVRDKMNDFALNDCAGLGFTDLQNAEITRLDGTPTWVDMSIGQAKISKLGTTALAERSTLAQSASELPTDFLERLSGLSYTERNVLKLMLEDDAATNKSIAQELLITEERVRQAKISMSKRLRQLPRERISDLFSDLT